MARYKRFEDLPVWRDACDLAVSVYSLTSKGPLSRDWKMSQQMQSAAVSVSSNIAEGFELGTRKGFARHLYIARGSCGEVRSQIHVAVKIGHLNSIHVQDVLEKAAHVSRQLTLLIANIQGKKAPK